VARDLVYDIVRRQWKRKSALLVI